MAGAYAPSLLTKDAPLGSARSRIKHLDGLRGLAALAVVFCHYFAAMESEPGIQHFLGHYAVTGVLGVDVFFTLSGFLITGVLLNEEKAEGYFSRFYIRRVFRLAPLYYAYLAVIFALELATHTVDGANLAANALYVQGFYLAYLGHWIGGTGMLWTLAVEEQFYLVLPALVYRLRPHTLAVLALTAGIASIVLRAALTWNGFGFAAYVLIFSHMEGLCLGALAALAVREIDPFSMKTFLRMARWPAVLGMALLLFFCRDLGGSSRVFRIIAPVLTALITAGIILRPGKTSLWLESAPLRWLGRYSYAIYVLQFLPGILIQHWLFQHTHRFVLRFAGDALIIGILLLEARLSWQFLEGPMLRMRERYYPTK